MATVNKNKLLYAFIALLTTANLVTLALVWKNNRPDHRHADAGPRHPQEQSLFQYLSGELQLDQKQEDAYALLRDEHQKNSREMQDSIRAAKDKLFSLLQLSGVPENMINAQSNKAAAFQTQLDVITFHHFQKVRALCNAAQQIKFDRIIQEALRVHGPGQRPPPPGR